MTTDPGFEPSLFKFLADLKKNNDREWFLRNKQRYEEDVRDPMLRFIAGSSAYLKRISAQYLGDPRPAGGSLMRPYRDTRFSSDKSPYKTMTGALFRHAQGKTVPAPAFFLHLEPGKSFAGIGVHGPDPQTLATIRRRIAADPQAWKAATSGKVFRERCRLIDESLQRPPKGFPADHPCIEDLKRKHLCTQTFYPDKEVCADGFIEVFFETCKAAGPFMRFLTEAVGLPW